MSNICIIVLAAGEGKRMKSELPKVMHEICAKPMVNYVVDAARKVSAKKLIVVIGRKNPQVKDILAKDVRVVYQNKPLGTADAVKAAQKEIPSNVEDVIVLYGDTPLIKEETIRSLLCFHKEKNASCTVLTTFLNHPRGYGRVLRSESGQFVGIIEDKDANYQQKTIKEINTGMYCFKKTDLLEALAHVQPLNAGNEFYLTDVFGWLLKKNKKIEATVAEDYQEVLGVNSRAEFMDAAQIIRKRILEKYMEDGVLIMDFSTVFIDASAQIGAGTKIFPFTFIEGGVVIGKDCSIGPFCHLREGVVLEDEVYVGNFTEIKNSTLGTRTLMSHVSYLGDAQVGKEVNIGAGMIVANYDGQKKNKTTIKDGAFLGSNSVLIAPVVVGKNAVVGAGSVVTKNHNIPDKATVVGAPAREIKESKKKKR